MANNESDVEQWDKDDANAKRREQYKSRKQVTESDLKLEQYFGLPNTNLKQKLDK